MPRAFITGAAGQDGSYMVDLLLNKGYEVHGLVRPSGEDRLWRLTGALHNKKFNLHYGDINDPSLPFDVAEADYDELYHFAAQTQVMQSYEAPEYSFQTNTVSVTRFLDALLKYSPKTKFYFAATSEMFGDMRPPQRGNESFPLGGRSPYAAAKIAAHLTCRVYRKRGLFVVSGIGFNHESRRRGENFVTRKIGLGVQKFKTTRMPVVLGNVRAQRDWFHAKDMVRGAWLAMQHDQPDEFVFSMGRTHTVMEFARLVCDYLNVDVNEAICVNPAHRRPWDVDYLCGDPEKARTVLGWEPVYSIKDIVMDVCNA